VDAWSVTFINKKSCALTNNYNVVNFNRIETWFKKGKAKVKDGRCGDVHEVSSGGQHYDVQTRDLVMYWDPCRDVDGEGENPFYFFFFMLKKKL